MSIELGYVAECDGCDEQEIGYHDTVEEFIDIIKVEGWSVKKLDAYEMPLCYCKSCTALKEPNHE